jgi:hypothetical protein
MYAVFFKYFFLPPLAACCDFGRPPASIALVVLRFASMPAARQQGTPAITRGRPITTIQSESIGYSLQKLDVTSWFHVLAKISLRITVFIRNAP